MAGGALDGIKVVELATMVSGPYCGKLLADMGANVIKVEPPGGDPSRQCGPFPESGPCLERSALFLYNNTSKRGVTLNLDSSEGLEAFKRLLRWADVLIDNHPSQRLESLGLSWGAMCKLNPALVYTSITPYGRTGPQAGIKGDELTIIHAGGLGNLLPTRSVDVSRAPVKLGGYAVGYHGGIVAAVATMAALLGRMKTGRGQVTDISLQEVILALVGPNLASTRYEGTTWSRVPDRPPALGRMKTSDGYIVVGVLENHHFRLLMDLMGNPEWAAAPEWYNRAYRVNHIMEIAPMMDEWMLHQRKDEVHHKGAKKGIAIGPINSAKEVMNDEQYAARDYFVEVDHPEAGKHRYAGWPYKMSATPPRVMRPAPLLGQHNQEVYCTELGYSLEESEHLQHEGGTAERRIGMGNNMLPLQGVRVADFSWLFAGPYGTMLLATLGAEVIRVESHKRTDLSRRSVVWPLHDPAPHEVPPNQAISFNAVNLNKKSVTLDLTKPEGVQLAKRLVAISDIVIDNMRPGSMATLGLGYEELRQVRPDIIVVSSSSRGQQGPEKDYAGYATTHQAIGGGAYITGYADDAPSPSLGDVDIMNATTAAYAALAALYHRSQAGEGQFIDFSQCEGVSSIIGELLLGYEMNSQIPERMGNAHPQYAPHNVYRCWGVDRWLAIEVHSDEEFATLADVMGRPELAEDPRFTNMASRKENESELDRIIGEWTRPRDRDWMVNEFCQAGLAAAPSRNARDLYADPHLRARDAFVSVNHPELGELELVGAPWKMSDCEMAREHAPLLGEHNDYVLRELLGLSQAEVADLRKNEVIM